MTHHFFFYLGLSFMLMHEMDAIRCKEWRIFPGLSSLSDKVGQVVFIIVHLPLFLALFWGLSNTEDIDRFSFYGSTFMLVHLCLHLVYLKHKNNEFKDILSWTIISGAGACGLVDLIIS